MTIFFRLSPGISENPLWRHFRPLGFKARPLVPRQFVVMGQRCASRFSVPAPSCDARAMETNRTLRDIAGLENATVLVIRDVWTGDSPYSPLAAIYELRRGARGGFAGGGRLSTSIDGERLVDVAIPSSAAKRFLEKLADAAVSEGAYTPHQGWTDDFPFVEIALHGVRVEHPSVLLFSKSQGEFHAPWGACIGGDLWTLPGDEVGRALAALRGPLKRSMLDRMTKA